MNKCSLIPLRIENNTILHCAGRGGALDTVLCLVYQEVKELGAGNQISGFLGVPGTPSEKQEPRMKSGVPEPGRKLTIVTLRSKRAKHDQKILGVQKLLIPEPYLGVPGTPRNPE